MHFVWPGLALGLMGSTHPGQYDHAALLGLARKAVIAEITHAKPPVPLVAHQVKPVFVTIEIGGNVHGCRGSLETRSQSLESEIILAARSAAAHDPRYRPITPKQLANFKVTITIVEARRPITDVAEIVPTDGLALESGSHWGIVLPWEGKDPRVRLQWAYRKAGVAEGTSANLYRLIAERF